jgi:hypothetical protein
MSFLTDIAATFGPVAGRAALVAICLAGAIGFIVCLGYVAFKVGFRPHVY